MRLPAPRRYSLKQIAVIVGLLVASAALAVMISTDNVGYTLLGLFAFGWAAAFVCILEK